MCPKDLADHVLSALGEIHNIKLKGLVSQDANGLQIILVQYIRCMLHKLGNVFKYSFNETALSAALFAVHLARCQPAIF